jgi:Fic family protein
MVLTRVKMTNHKNNPSVPLSLLQKAITSREVGHASTLLAFIILEKINTSGLKFYLTAKEAVKTLGISRDTYYRWLNTLINKGYIVRIDTNYYALNPDKHPTTS